MTEAQRLVAALLDAVSPREFLKRVGKGAPTMDQVRFQLDMEPESIWELKGSFGHPEDEEYVRQQLRDGNEWAWCRVHVRATWWDRRTGREYEGDDYLGGCSYGSEEDFKQPGGYYDDMKAQAYADLVAKYEAGQSEDED